MVTTSKEVSLVNRTPNGKVLCKTFPGTNSVKLSKFEDPSRPVSFITESEVYQLADAAKTMRDGERNELLILVLFQCCLRISEALQLTPGHKKSVEGIHVLGVIGKGHKPRLVPCPEKLSYHLGDFAQRQNMQVTDRYFPIGRIRAWQIIRKVAVEAGLDYKRIYPHLFRHAGAVNRLMKTGNLKSLQILLGHSDSKMTMRYQSTMQTIQALEVESKVEFRR
jgi:integrase/recombinase XerD